MLLLVEQNIHSVMGFVMRVYFIENGPSVLEGNRETLLGETVRLAVLHGQLRLA